MAVGIVGYGSYVPRLRITRVEYQKAWGSYAAGIKEKAVMDFDEDTLTMGIEAAKEALLDGIKPDQVGTLALASTHFPYEEKALCGTVAEMLGLPERLFAFEHDHSTLAGTEAFLAAVGSLNQQKSKNALVIISDAPQAEPKSTLEHGLGAGAAAFLIGEENVLAEIEYSTSYVQENMGERYRNEGQSYLNDIGVKGFTSLAYKHLVSQVVHDVLTKMERKPVDYKYLILHEQDAKTPKSLGQKLGFNEEQMSPSLIYAQTGDTGACSPFLSLTAVLDLAQKDDCILMVSYGSGSGSQAISLRVVKEQTESKRLMLKTRLEHKKFIDYVQYLKLKRQIL